MTVSEKIKTIDNKIVQNWKTIRQWAGNENWHIEKEYRGLCKVYEFDKEDGIKKLIKKT